VVSQKFGVRVGLIRNWLLDQVCNGLKLPPRTPFAQQFSQLRRLELVLHVFAHFVPRTATKIFIACPQKGGGLLAQKEGETQSNLKKLFFSH
jgi:hypothetical protein